jgi:diguanylate cyclase (GGDEF)-like protein/PAS domain S-box-containing protein
MIPTDPFSSLFDLLPVGAYRSTPQGRQLRANAALVRINGYQNEVEFIAAIKDIGAECYVDLTRRADFLSQMNAHGYVSGYVSEIYRHKTGERIWISENAHAVRDADGAILYFEGTIEDITDRHAALENLHASERRYRAFTNKSLYSTVVLMDDGTITFASPGVEKLLGVAPEVLTGTSIFASMHDDDLATHREEFRRVQVKRNTGAESIARHLHTDGGWRYLASLATDCRDDPAISGIVINWRDVTDAQQIQQRLRDLAENDSLTGLINRAHFESIGVEMLEDAQAENAQLALFFIDLNRFKLVNDSHGHSVGDQVLKEISQRLRSALRGNDVLARLGGDEFASLIRVDGRATATQFATRLINAVAPPVLIGALRFDLGASIGISLFPGDADSFDDLLGHADLAMFEAKAQRASASKFFKPAMLKRALAQVAVVSELHRASLHQDMQVYFQPVVNLRTEQWTGFEALVRWQHPKRGLILPAEFIKAAEEQGLIGKLGIIVAEKMFTQSVRWKEAFGIDFQVALNVSAYQLRDDGFLTYLTDAFTRHDVNPNRCTLEITETALVETAIGGGDILMKLRALGVRIALDDLGIGFSSFDYLKRFPIDVVKLDRSFVMGLPDNRVDAAIVRSMVILAKSLGLTIIGEGIETPEQAAFLLDVGCEHGQGFRYSEALPAEDATRRIQEMQLGQPLKLT